MNTVRDGNRQNLRISLPIAMSEGICVVTSKYINGGNDPAAFYSFFPGLNHFWPVENEIESVKMAKQKQKAEAKRKATPVVGDMQPLMEALPELSYLTTGGMGRKPLKSPIKAKAEPADFCLMKQAQKHQLLDQEVARFHEVISDPQYRANPLLAISEHLSKRLRQGGEGEPL
uniref:Family with sequence similarity 207 member A n=1 Tax=Ficedula albicollis TaxID=59894 RepID=A0A803W662_FICAL